jgi:hypothetical protein
MKYPQKATSNKTTDHCTALMPSCLSDDYFDVFVQAFSTTNNLWWYTPRRKEAI